MHVALYKTVNGEERLIDYGFFSKVEDYQKQGYDVKISDGPRKATYKHLKAEFDALWDTLSPFQQNRLSDLPVDDEMTIAEKLGMLKAEVVSISRRVITVCNRRPKKLSIWATIIREVRNVFTIQPEVCYA